jgi:hypothetical protein
VAGIATDPTPALRAARRTLEEFDEVEIVEDWAADGDWWFLVARFTPAGLAYHPSVPPATVWHVRIEATYPAGRIDLMPALAGGMTATFPHQLPNRATKREYRTGKVCVATDSEGNLRRAGDAEPRAATDRLAWHVARALDWLRDAASGRLLAPGDWYETPFYVMRHAAMLGVAVHEGPETFAAWQSTPDRVGLVELREIGPKHSFVLATRFTGLSGKALNEPRWGSLAQVAKLVGAGVWIRFEDVIKLPPYAAPWTWAELRTVAQEQGFDLDARLRTLARHVRDGERHFALLGYPVPIRVGDPTALMHWQPMLLPALDPLPRRPPRGFRPGKDAGLWLVDRQGPLRDSAELEWRPADNWHPDQIGSRGRLQPALRSARVLMIGVGALGAPIAEMLVRAGVTDVTLVDADSLLVGNLVRHTGTLLDLAEAKAEVIGFRLNAANPSARVQSFTGRFPESGTQPAQAFDLVIDTTGEDSVLEAMEAHAWPQPTSFASFAINVGARRLFSYFARGTTFPRADFEAQFKRWRDDEAERNEDMPWEAVGCWHPVFPARVDEVWLLAAAAIGQLEGRWPFADGISELVVLERSEAAGAGLTGLTVASDP